MHFQYIPYIWPFIASAVVTLTLAIYALHHKNVRGACPFGLTMLVTALWAASYALEVTGIDLSTKLFWARVQSISYTLAPVLWLIMVFQFIERDHWITKRNILLLLVLPVIAILLAWTNNLHGLMWQNARLDTNGVFPILAKNFSVGFWIIAVYSYSLNIVSEILLVMSWRRKSALYREQSLALFIGLALLFIPNILYIFSIEPLNRYDLTSAVAGISGIFIAWGIFRFKLFDIVPVARENIIENMSDGLIVLDTQTRLVDMNPAARAILGNIPRQSVGQESRVFFKDWPVIAEICHDKPELPRELVIKTGGLAKIYEISCLSLSDKRGKHYGLSITFHDITEQRKTQSRLLEQQRALAVSGERERLARDLHDNLGQVFGFINVQAQAIKHELSNAGVDIASRKIDRLVEAAQAAHHDMHEYIQSVKRTTADKDFISALKEEEELFNKQTGIDIRMDIPAELPVELLKQSAKTNMLNIIKEALNNIRKHAEAKKVIIEIITTGDQILATIIDDGKGFDIVEIGKKPAQGLGINIMKERAREIGGKFSIDSAPGKGTTITLNIPLEEIK